MSITKGTLAKVTAKTAVEVCQRFKLGDEASPLLREGQTPAQHLDTLTEKKLDLDAIRFLAHALPKREAVWWACLCARAVLGAAPSPAETAALQAAEKWVADPVEDNRRPTMALAETAGMGTPAGCAAAAAFWTGGSVAPPKLPVVAPGETHTAQAVAGALLLGAVLTEPAKASERRTQFLKLGIEVANGAQLWKEPARK